MNFQFLAKEAQRYSTKVIRAVSKKSPTLLTGLGVFGVVAAVVNTHMATKQAVAHMEEVKERDDYKEPESKVEEVILEVKETYQYYIPTAVVVTVTVVSIIQSNRINIKRIALLTDAYRMSENLRKEYQEKVKEVLGENKEKKVQTALAKDAVLKDNSDVVYNTGQGNCLFKDCFTGRKFFQDPEKMRQARNNFDAQLLDEDYASLNEWFYLIKLDRVDVGDVYGFNIERTGRRDMSGIEFIPVMDEYDRPITLVKYDVELNFDMFEPH